MNHRLKLTRKSYQVSGHQTHPMTGELVDGINSVVLESA